MNIKHKLLILILAGGMVLGVTQFNSNNVTVQAARMHYFNKCNGAKNPFKRIGKFIGVVYHRPVKSYDKNGHIINKKWYGNVYSNGYRYIKGRKYYHLAFKPKKYLRASELNAHNSKNFPGRIVVYRATKQILAKQEDGAYPDGSLMEEGYPIKKNQSVYRDMMQEKSDFDYNDPIMKEWEETGEFPGGTGFSLSSLKTIKRSWLVNACLGSMQKHPKGLKSIPDVEQMWIIPKEQKYLKRGGRYVDGYYKDRKKAGFQFTNNSIKHGYCWSDVVDDPTLYEGWATDTYDYTINNTSCGLIPVGHDNLVRVFNEKTHPNGYNIKHTLYKVHLYI